MERWGGQSALVKTKTLGSPDRKYSFHSVAEKFTASGQHSSRPGESVKWAGVVLSVGITRAEAVYRQIQPALGDTEWNPWEDKGKRPWKKPSTNPSHFFQMWLLCLEKFSSCGLGGGLCESVDPQRHLEELWATANNIWPPRPPLTPPHPHPPSSFHSFLLLLIANTCGVFPGSTAKPTVRALSSALRHVPGP